MTPEKSTTTVRRSALTPKLPTLTLLCALSVLPLNVFLPSLANIAQDFRADYALLSLSLAGYAVVAVALELIMGPLSDRFGRRPIVMVSLATFTIGSIGWRLCIRYSDLSCVPFAPGAITSCYPISMAIIRDTVGKEQTASRIGYTAMIWAVAPMIGLALGRRYDPYGWRSPFLDHRGRPDGGQRKHALFSIMLFSAGCGLLAAVLAALVPGDSQSCRT
ncbi:MFS transporter [Mesorhizobium sp. ORM16]|uniref:MFS transporter n=1 Tax=Mesorhizobium sp. ORM16 TaxID=3376989 RepID=UPI003857796C